MAERDMTFVPSLVQQFDNVTEEVVKKGKWAIYFNLQGRWNETDTDTIPADKALEEKTQERLAIYADAFGLEDDHRHLYGDVASWTNAATLEFYSEAWANTFFSLFEDDGITYVEMRGPNGEVKTMGKKIDVLMFVLPEHKNK